jgi:hypothetical protein
MSNLSEQILSLKPGSLFWGEGLLRCLVSVVALRRKPGTPGNPRGLEADPPSHFVCWCHTCHVNFWLHVARDSRTIEIERLGDHQWCAWASDISWAVSHGRRWRRPDRGPEIVMVL